MNIKLYDSELKIMELLWKYGDMSAKQLAVFAQNSIGWSKTTTYTIIGKCIAKGVIKRFEPDFICHAVIEKKQVQEYEMVELINKVFDGASDKLVASILENECLSKEELDRIFKIIDKYR